MPSFLISVSVLSAASCFFLFPDTLSLGPVRSEGFPGLITLAMKAISGVCRDFLLGISSDSEVAF